jgi:hypothetical protein
MVSFTSWPLYTQRKETPVPKDRRLSGARASLEALKREKVFYPHLESNHNSLVVQPMA